MKVDFISIDFIKNEYRKVVLSLAFTKNGFTHEKSNIQMCGHQFEYVNHIYILLYSQRNKNKRPFISICGSRSTK